jgi:hypothetical protein
MGPNSIALSVTIPHPSQGMAGESRKGFLSSAEGATARKRSGKKNGMSTVVGQALA